MSDMLHGTKAYVIKGNDGITRQKHIDQLTDGFNPASSPNHDLPRRDKFVANQPLIHPEAASMPFLPVELSTSSVTNTISGGPNTLPEYAAPSLKPPRADNTLPILPGTQSNLPVRASARIKQPTQRLAYNKLGGEN